MPKEEDYKQLLDLVREPVSSSNLAARAYSEALQAIVLQFKKGEVYAYLDCSQQDYDDLVNAESQGKHFNLYIKNTKRTIQLA